MTEPVRLLVLFLDDDAEAAWREPLTKLGVESGWDILTGPVTDWPMLTDRCLILSTDPDWGIVIPAERSTVVSSAEARRAMTDAIMSKADVEMQGARFAKASMILLAGGLLLAGDAEAITISELGGAKRSGAPALSRGRDTVLDLYRGLPPVPGAAAMFEAESLYYPRGAELDGGIPEIDLTGRARILFHGPHIYLTPGLWRVSLELMIDPEGKPAPLRFEWAHGDDRVSMEADVAKPGVYQIALERRWDVMGPCQIVGNLRQAAFQGRMTIGKATITLLPDAP